MGRFSSFVFGILIGGAAVFVGLKYHVVRADDGLHMIPKQQAEFREVYVDIREFGPQDWTRHPELAAAIVKAEKGELFQGAVRQGVRDTIDGLLE